MAVGAITMILANVGLSIFNNLANNRQNKQIAEKREEFERAVRENQRERMLQLMREGQQLTLELEEQKHQERLSELNDQFDSLIKELAFANAIEHWPLKTLPVVMKNQALGNLLAKQEEHVALHCILTNSGCTDFDQYVLPKVESALEEYCNLHWSALTGSPILFYSGAWKSNDVPTGTQIDVMRTALSNLPTLIITPFFRPQDHKLVFKFHVWGVGYVNAGVALVDEYIIDPSEEPQSETMERSTQKRIRFQNDYSDELKWLAEEGLIDEAVEDIVPYLQCLIGYIADTYFWSAFGTVPSLPRLLTDGTINTDGMKYLIDDTRLNYEKLFRESENDNVCSDYARLCLLEGLLPLHSKESNRDELKKLVLGHCNKQFESDISDVIEAVGKTLWSLLDIRFIHRAMSISDAMEATDLIHALEPKLASLKSIDYDFAVLDKRDRTLLETKAEEADSVAMYRLGELYEYSIGVKGDREKALQYYRMSSEHGFILADVKLGTKRYEDLDELVICNLHALRVIQIEDLFADSVLKKGMRMTGDDFRPVYQRINDAFMSSGKIYSHPGLIFHLASIMKQTDFDKYVAESMLQFAAKIGYVEPINIS